MPGFRAFAQTRFFHFDEVADVCAFQQLCPWAQTGEWPDRAGGFKVGIFYHAVRADFTIVANHAVFDHATGANFDAVTQRYVAFQNNVSIDFDVAPVIEHPTQIETRRIAQHHARQQ